MVKLEIKFSDLSPENSILNTSLGVLLFLVKGHCDVKEMIYFAVYALGVFSTLYFYFYYYVILIEGNFIAILFLDFFNTNLICNKNL